MDRRVFLKASATGLAGLAITSCGGGGNNNGSTAGSLNTGVFSRTFMTPTQLLGTKNTATGRIVFNLLMQKGTKQFTGSGVTQTMGINGSFLAPTLRMQQNDLVDLNVTNQIGQETTLHWHGMRVPSNMDGSPHQLIAPNTTWNAAYQVIQRASTNWYHPHPHGTTAPQVYAGLAGMLIVDDAETLALDLPKTYGTDDFPVIVQDREMAADGTFAYSATQMEKMQGKKGNTMLINGVIDSALDVPAKEVRFRLLNGSNSRIYKLAFSNGLAIKQIATEQGLLASPVSLPSVTMSPGERVEIVVDFTGAVGQSFVLQDLNTGIGLFQANVVASKIPATTTPATLTTALAPLQRNQSVRSRQFILSMGQSKVYINKKQMDINRIDEAMVLNQVEILDIQNTSNRDHNFHIHGAYFQILSRNGGAPLAHETGLKDTVYLPANAKVEAIIQFTQYAANATNPFMYHCHILEHEDAGMMGQLTVA